MRRLVNIANHNQKITALLAYHGYVAASLKYRIIVWSNSVVFDKCSDGKECNISVTILFVESSFFYTIY